MPLVKLPGFDEAVRRHTWQGSRAVEKYTGARHCTRCEFGTVVTMTVGIQHALFRDAGYGAAEQRTVTVCLACGRVQVVALDTLNPRHA